MYLMFSYESSDISAPSSVLKASKFVGARRLVLKTPSSKYNPLLDFTAEILKSHTLGSITGSKLEGSFLTVASKVLRLCAAEEELLFFLTSTRLVRLKRASCLPNCIGCVALTVAPIASSWVYPE